MVHCVIYVCCDWPVVVTTFGFTTIIRKPLYSGELKTRVFLRLGNMFLFQVLTGSCDLRFLWSARLDFFGSGLIVIIRKPHSCICFVFILCMCVYYHWLVEETCANILKSFTANVLFSLPLWLSLRNIPRVYHQSRDFAWRSDWFIALFASYPQWLALLCLWQRMGRGGTDGRLML